MVTLLQRAAVASNDADFDWLGAERTGVRGRDLGLSLSQGLIVAMGGKMGFSSVMGQGTTFWIELPLGEPSRW